MNAVVDVIGEMKSKIVVATEDGVDREKVQAEIDQLKDQLTSIVRLLLLAARTGYPPMAATAPLSWLPRREMRPVTSA